MSLRRKLFLKKIQEPPIMMSTVNNNNNIYICVIIFVLTDGEEERPHQSEVVASDESQHDFPRPTGQSQEGDPLWRHLFYLFFTGVK